MFFIMEVQPFSPKLGQVFITPQTVSYTHLDVYKRQLLTKPGIYNFIGFANYLEALQSSFFLKSVVRTLYFAFATVGLELVLGLGVALVLQQKFRGRGLVRGLIILPWALPTSVNGIMWKWIYNANYGVLNALLKRLGVIERYQVWLADPTRALHLVMLANIWKETPVGVLMFLAVLEQIPRELYEAALVDGANTLKKFWYITLPMLKPMMVTLAIIKIIWAIREFDIFYIITRGGPGAVSYTHLHPAMIFSYSFPTTKNLPEPTLLARGLMKFNLSLIHI